MTSSYLATLPERHGSRLGNYTGNSSRIRSRSRSEPERAERAKAQAAEEERLAVLSDDVRRVALEEEKAEAAASVTSQVLSLRGDDGVATAAPVATQILDRGDTKSTNSGRRQSSNDEEKSSSVASNDPSAADILEDSCASALGSVLAAFGIDSAPPVRGVPLSQASMTLAADRVKDAERVFTPSPHVTFTSDESATVFPEAAPIDSESVEAESATRTDQEKKANAPTPASTARVKIRRVRENPLSEKEREKQAWSTLRSIVAYWFLAVIFQKLIYLCWGSFIEWGKAFFIDGEL